ncbi:MAG TPA: YbdK family carboxylate-amine ligase [Longimicrobium sp.]|nr:YbdK family carboxylate-amine ligase [Longimicrobium sp.]
MTISPRDFTVGVEEEYQLVDAGTGDLRSRARWVIAGDWSGDVKPEMQQHTIEVETGVCAGTNCVRDDLARLRFQAAVAAEAQGLRIVAAGTHPFSDAGGHAFTDQEVYAAIRDEYRELAETQSIFGMHVHVGVPPHLDRVRVANTARLYLPHLLAVTASSPFFQGRDTGYCSFRTLLWRRWPRTGAPPRFESAAEFELLLRWLTETRCIDGPGRLYWDLRPHHRYPTIEFRAQDVTPRLEDAVAAAALARAVVAGVAEGLLREPALPSSVAQPLLGENAWRASRDGTDAVFVDVFAGEPRTVPAADAVLGLAETLHPLAAELGDAAALGALAEVFERGCAAVRMRQVAGEMGGDLRRVTDWLASETLLGLGLDRRTEQRLEEANAQ